VHVIVESPDFAADAKAAGLSEADIDRIVTRVASDPEGGAVIPGTGGLARSGSLAVARARAAAIVSSRA
jgi:hypothetical protein